MCFSAFNLIIVLPLILYPAYHYFLHLLSTNHKCTQPCYFPLAVQTCYSKADEDFGFIDQEFYMSDYPQLIAYGVMVPFRYCIFDSVRFSLL
jgi:hypothetical protein